MPAGRPTLYSEALVEEIVSRMCRGETLTSICALDHMPEFVTLWRWERSNEVFCKALAQARADRAHVWAEQGIEIADDGSRDIVMVKGRDGEEQERANHDHIQRSKLRVDTRLRLAAKHNPAAYGDSVAVTGAGGGPIATIDATDHRVAARRIAMALALGARQETA